MGRNKFGHYQHADVMVLSSIMSHVFYYKHPGFFGGEYFSFLASNLDVAINQRG